MNLNNIEKGFYGLSVRWGKLLAEAGAFCLERAGHKTGVKAIIKTEKLNDEIIYWNNNITKQIKLSWNDNDEATEFGATSIALLTAVNLTDYTILARSIKGTGFDFWLGKSEKDKLFQKKARLEISGIQKGNLSKINSRINIKIKQTNKSDYIGLPAYIAIIEFSNPYINFTKK